MPKDPYNLEDSIGYILGRTTRTLGGRLNRHFTDRGYDITCEQWAVLVNLGKINGQTQQELAVHTCKDKTSMTRLIDGMEKRNLVVRIPNKQDKRQKLIYLTAKGKDFHQKLLTVAHHTVQEAQAGINPKDIKVCKDVLNKVYENVLHLNQNTTVANATKKKKT
jgi:DNA-binding MarR family transcriptional regulator